MSNVTSVIIYTWTENDRNIFIEPPPCSARPELKESERFVKIDMIMAGGYKFMEWDVYACAFNYVNMEALTEWFDNLPWREGEKAIMVWDEGIHTHDFYLGEKDER